MSDNELSQQQRIDAFSRDLALFLDRITDRGSDQRITNLPKVITPPEHGKNIDPPKQRKQKKKHEQESI